MAAEKQTYTREEKIAYYARSIAYLEMAITRNKNQLAFAKKRLMELQLNETEQKQNWNSDLSAELASKKKARE